MKNTIKIVMVFTFLLFKFAYSMKKNEVLCVYISNLDAEYKTIYKKSTFGVLARQHSSDEMKARKGLQEAVKKNDQPLEIILEEENKKQQK